MDVGDLRSLATGRCHHRLRHSNACQFLSSCLIEAVSVESIKRRRQFAAPSVREAPLGATVHLTQFPPRQGEGLAEVQTDEESKTAIPITFRSGSSGRASTARGKKVPEEPCQH